MKIYALFLPQFHMIPENDEWWGQGFTEWSNVRKAEPLFRGHIQPKHPQNQNYYDLLDKNTVVWQTNILNTYKIDGLIYYHYYFNGRKLLEKPAENLLKWTDINQNFFFNWANHSWNRAWNGSREVLLEQTYGNLNDWREHFEYLLPFFKDKRYVKIEGCPVFMIYNPSFPEKAEMMKYFDKWCKEEGFKGLYLVEESLSLSNPLSFEKIKKDIKLPTRKLYLTQPSIGRQWYLNKLSIGNRFWHKLRYKLSQKGVIKRPVIYNGDKLLKTIIENEPKDDVIVHGAFFEWDNTPRHKSRGYVITPVKKDTFFKYLDRIKESDMMIVNAWNEWAEGMMIEPTEELGDTYLHWIRDWKEANM